MQFPESWLREFCNPPLDTQQLADALTMAGLEVEDLDPVAPPFTGIVVGEIITTEQHPDADRLRICQVDVGVPERLSIVCGAPNAQTGHPRAMCNGGRRTAARKRWEAVQNQGG